MHAESRLCLSWPGINQFLCIHWRGWFRHCLAMGTIVNVSKQQIIRMHEVRLQPDCGFFSLFEAESICNHFPVFTELLMTASSWNLLARAGAQRQAEPPQPPGARRLSLFSRS